MTFKSMPAGNLIDYVQSEKDYKGQDRPLPPKWIGPDPKLTEEFLRCGMPPHVRTNRKRRWVGHCRQHLTHLIVGFAEGYEAVAPFRQTAIRTMECLVAAGMPLDSLQFIWCEHPLLERSHVHGGLVRSLLPGGGAYEPALLGNLATDCSWLVSRRLSLSLPTDAARLIRGGEFSYKHAHRKRIDEICRMTLEKFKKNKLQTREQFLALLETELAETVLAAPGRDGWPRVRTIRPLGRLYRHCVAIEGQDDSVIWLAGMVCRHSFTAAGADWELERRRRKFKNAFAVFDRFMGNLQDRIQAQKQRYPIRTGLPAVTPEAFQWLDPKNDARRYLALDSMQVSDRPVAEGVDLPEISLLPETSAIAPRAMLDRDVSSIPEAAYPFYSDLRTESLDITDPHIWLGDDLDEPLEQNAWMSFGFNPPPELVPSEPDQTNPGPAPTAESSEFVFQKVQAESAATASAEHRVMPEAVPAEMAPAQDPTGAHINQDSPEPGPGIAFGSRNTEAEAGKPRQPPEEKPSGLAPISLTSPAPDAVEIERLIRLKRLWRARCQLQRRISTSVAMGWEAQQQDNRLQPRPSIPTTPSTDPTL